MIAFVDPSVVLRVVLAASCILRRRCCCKSSIPRSSDSPRMMSSSELLRAPAASRLLASSVTRGEGPSAGVPLNQVHAATTHPDEAAHRSGRIIIKINHLERDRS